MPTPNIYIFQINAVLLNIKTLFFGNIINVFNWYLCTPISASQFSPFTLNNFFFLSESSYANLSI